MLGAIIGDIVGSRWEFDPTNDYNFPLFTNKNSYTDDTICTVAVADALLHGSDDYGKFIHKWCRKYPHPMGGYGGRFAQWVASDAPKPYNSYGNGAAMRVSPVAMWFADTNEAKEEARKTAACSHNHPEGMKGAAAVAEAINLAIHTCYGKSEDEQTQLAMEIGMSTAYNNKYEWDIDLEKATNRFDETCQGTVPVALCIITESKSFEDAIRKAVALGADADTLGAIVGSIAEHIWGIPEWIKEEVRKYLPSEMLEVIAQFYNKFMFQQKKNNQTRQHIVFLTGAGISAESGLSTFRGKDGLWTKEEFQYLASTDCLYNDTQKSLDFYNMRRKRLAEVEPNEAHKLIAELEKEYDVTVITQNVDNLHERAGSTNIIHLHGELTKVCSTRHRYDEQYVREYPLTSPIELGDDAGDDSQLRPYIVMFGESVPNMRKAIRVVESADIFVVVGTSLVVYPAAGLIDYAHPNIPKYVIDPEEMKLCEQLGFKHFKATANEGMKELIEILQKLQSQSHR